MLGEQYQVDYVINLRDNASAGIRKFSQAASKLSKAAESFSAFQKQFNQIASSFSKPINISINTQNAHKSLDKILAKIRKIKQEAGSVNLGVSGGVAGGRTGTAASPSYSSRQSYAGRQPAVRPLVSPNGTKPIIPRNLEYQVVGPTRLGNIAMLDMFKGMGIMYGMSAIGSGVRDIVSQSTEYENIIQTAKNILKTNYKGKNFNSSFIDMERIVREVGIETKFTAPEVADAVKFLAMAGLDIDAIKKSIRPIADIALIGDTELGQTADVMTNIMTAYGINPNDMRKTANVMTRTFTMSNTTLMELAESFKMAGSMLHLANVPFETAAAAFGVLGDAGIKATMAGTTMRTIMNNLRNPTKTQSKYWDLLGVRRYDEFGNLRDINDIFRDLNNINGNGERSAEAKRRYDELQKQFAPKFEGLQEGSREYNSVLAEYDKESEEIRKLYGGVDVFRLFRLTAASGAGVLMSSVDKWNKIIEENFLSEGLSNKLADEKKNTIAGMWAQLKSAFQEGGLKVFEENDSKFRGYLQKGIEWFKSDDFTAILRDVIDLVTDLGGALLKLTKYIVELYRKFSPLIKTFLKFQLFLKGANTIVGSIRQIGNAMMYYGGGFFKQMSRPSFAGNAVGAGTGAFGSMLYYGIPKKWMGPGYKKLLETGSPALAVRANDNYNPMNHAANTALLNKYKSANRRINAMNSFSGIGMLGGSLLGGFIGNNFDSENGMMAGSLIGGGLGALAPLLAGSGPWGWVIGGAAVAITGIVSSIVKYNREMAKAKAATDSYMASLRTLNIGKMDISSTDDIFNANLRITTSLLHTENEKLELQAELWRKIRQERESSQENYDQNTGKNVVNQILGIRDKYYWKPNHPANSEGLYSARAELFGELSKMGLVSSYQSGDGTLARNLYEMSYGGKTVTYNGNRLGDVKGGKMENDYVNEFAALQAAFDPENPLINQARETFFSRIKRAKSPNEYNDIVSQFWSDLNLPGINDNLNINNLKDKDFDAMLSDNSLMAYAEYAIPVMKQLESIVDAGAPYIDLLEQAKNFDFSAENVRLPMEKTQAVLKGVIGDPFFGNGFGQFGTPEWFQKVREYANGSYLGTDKNGNKGLVPNFAGGLLGDDFKERIQEVFGSVNEFYKSLTPEMQRFYEPYIDESYWNDIFDLTKYNTNSWHAPMVLPEEGNNTQFRYKSYQDMAPENLNEALALKGKGNVINPNYTNNNNVTLTFHIDNVNTTRDEEQLEEFVKNNVPEIILDTLQRGAYNATPYSFG